MCVCGLKMIRLFKNSQQNSYLLIEQTRSKKKISSVHVHEEIG